MYSHTSLQSPRIPSSSRGGLSACRGQPAVWRAANTHGEQFDGGMAQILRGWEEDPIPAAARMIA